LVIRSTLARATDAIYDLTVGGLLMTDEMLIWRFGSCVHDICIRAIIVIIWKKILLIGLFITNIYIS